MRYLALIFILSVIFIFTTAQAGGVTAVGVGAAMFCCVDGQIMMDASNSYPWAAIDEIYWDFDGDGQNWIGGNKSIFVTYPATWPAGGTYYPQLKVVDTDPPGDYDIDTSMGPFYVGEVIITVGTLYIEEGVPVQFGGEGSLPAELETRDYEWDFGDGSDPETGESVWHTYADAGPYTITLTVMYEDNEDWVCEGYANVTVH